MAMDFIRIRGARTHNLKNIDLDLPRDKLIVITGLSGSGKSSLAFDTIYAEGQRRYVESLSAYARQFLSVMEKPDVDHIEGLSPAISIEQKSTSHNPRSTVGTITEIYDYLRLLYARVGSPRCPDHDFPLEAQTVSQMVDQVLALDRRGAGRAALDAAGAGGARAQGRARCRCSTSCARRAYVRVRVDGVLHEIDAVPPLALRQKHTIEAVIDRFKPREDIKQRLAEVVRDRAQAGRRHGHRAVDWTMQAATPLLFSSQVQLPGLRLLAAGAGTAAVLVQLADRRLPDLRRPGRGAVLRSGARGGASRSCRWPPARCAAGTAATPTTSS